MANFTSQENEKDGIQMYINRLIGENTNIILRDGLLIIYADLMNFQKWVSK